MAAGVTRVEHNNLNQHDDGQHPQWGRLRNSDLKGGSPWARKVIVSLDGGGVKGYSSLLILKRLLEEIGDIERRTEPSHTNSADYSWSGTSSNRPGSPDGKFLMHHYVDYFFGTSTGGLSAIMLGRLRMTIDDAILNYYDVGRKVFQHPRRLTKGNLKMILKTRLSGKRMEQALKDATAPPLDDTAEAQSQSVNIAAEKELVRDTNPQSARTVVVAHRRMAYLFRSYDRRSPNPDLGADQQKQHLNPGPASTVPLWKAARATSAAPGWFPPMHIDGFDYQDGALAGCNNPVKVAYNEVKQVHPFHEPKVIISVGTGAKPDPEHETRDTNNRWQMFHRNAKDLQARLLNSHDVHTTFLDTHGLVEHADRDIHDRKVIYFRFDVPSNDPITNVQLGDWKGRDDCETETPFGNPPEGTWNSAVR